MTVSEQEQLAQFDALHDAVRAEYPTVLCDKPFVTFNPADTITTEDLRPDGLEHYNIPPGFDVAANEQQKKVVEHECLHGFLRRLDRLTGTPRAVFVTAFRVRYGYPADFQVQDRMVVNGEVVYAYPAGAASVEEAMAETFANAFFGKIVTTKSYLEERIDPLEARAWFHSLVPSAPKEAPTVDTITGIDISNHQGTVDFDKVKADAQKIAFVWCKLSEGIGYYDPTFARNFAEAKRVGLARGVYHFARADDIRNVATNEAKFFLDQLRGEGGLEAGDFVELDYEVSRPDGTDVAWCEEWLDTVAAELGFKPLLYLNLSYFSPARQPVLDWSPVVKKGYGLTLAHYGAGTDPTEQTPWPFIAMKQYSSSGAVDGITTRVDMDVFYGTVEQLKKYGKGATPVNTTDGGDQSATPNSRIVLIGQEAVEQEQKVGVAFELQGIWRWPNGKERAVKRQFVIYVAGHTPIALYPCLDPDDHPELEVRETDAAYFVVNVTA